MTQAQTPLHTGFTAASTTADVIRGINLVGKVAIVTGGYSGLGLETARVLLLAGARVIVPARDVARAKEAAGALPVEIEAMDLLDPESIDAFARRFLASGLPLDMLINSAGIMALRERSLDARGYELQFATNHLGHFQLTARLWPALQRTSGARVIAVSSMGHRFSPVLFDDINFVNRPYDPWRAYGQSKTANILFALELDKRGQSHDVRAFSLHPGGIADTNLGKYVPVDALKASGALDEHGVPVIDVSRDFKSVPMGAATQVWAATSSQLAGLGGLNCINCDIAPMLSPDTPVFTVEDAEARRTRPLGVLPYAIDPDAAARLWAVSEEMTGIRFLE